MITLYIFFFGFVLYQIFYWEEQKKKCSALRMPNNLKNVLIPIELFIKRVKGTFRQSFIFIEHIKKHSSSFDVYWQCHFL